jgi:N-acetylmuramoyl-L-alanine amidase
MLPVTSEAQTGDSLTLNSIKVAEANESVEVQLRFNAIPREPDKAFIIRGAKPRLVLDYKNAGFDIDKKRNRVEGEGMVKTVRFARRGKGERDLRLVLDLTTETVRHTPFISGNELTLIVQNTNVTAVPTPNEDVENNPEISSALASSAPQMAVVAAVPRYFKNQTPYPRLKPLGTPSAESVKPIRKPVIVIDPGHGGYDPGAIGVAGTKEKKITYAASLELQRQLIATGRYSVIITRSKDVYVPHEERLRIARAGGADLFISIHADATANSAARGASVYTLADRALTRSKRIVTSQNWIMDVDLSEQSDPVGDILVDLAQRKTATQSDEFAEDLITQLGTTTKLIGNTHRRAGYFVLLAPDVPAVLLELGFLSNAEDEKLLNQEAHRKKVLTSVTKAINLYFDKQKS